MMKKKNVRQEPSEKKKETKCFPWFLIDCTMRYKTFHCYRNKAKKKKLINDVSNGKFDFHFDSSPLVSGRDLKSSRGSVRTL